jgi:WD40 repeat protein
VALALKHGFEVMLEKEYATWAPALARLFVMGAGFVYRPRRDQWKADLRYLQQVEDTSGLLPAGWCLLSAPGLLFRQLAAALGASCERQWKERASVASGVLVVGVMGTLMVGPMLVAANPPAPVAALAFSPNGRMLAIAGTDSTVRLWDVATAKQHGQALTGAGTDLQFSPDGKVVATGGVGTSVHLWDVATGKAHGQPVGVVGSVFRFSPDGKLLAAVDAGYTVRLWDVATGKAHGQALPGCGAFFQFSPDGTILATGDGPSYTVRLWDVATGKAHGQPLSGAWSDFQFSSDSRLLATGDAGGTVQVWDVGTGKPYGQLLIGTGAEFKLSPDGKLLVTGGAEPTVQTSVTPGPVPGTVSDVLDGSVNIPANPGDAPGGGSATVRLWDVATGKLRGQPLTGAQSNFRFSPDGKLLATGGGHATVRLWDVATGKLHGQPLTGAGGGFQFSPDGKLLAFPGVDGTAELWDLTRQRLAVLEGGTSHPGAMGVMAADLALSVVASLLAAEVPRLRARARRRRGQHEAV